MKMIKKLILTTLIFLTVFSGIPLYSNAIGTIIDNGNSFIKEEGNIVAIPEEKLAPISETISSVLLAVAIGVTLISAVVMGINFVIQSVEEKAKIKESMVPWIIGIFISFGAYGIWKLTMSIFYKL